MHTTYQPKNEDMNKVSGVYEHHYRGEFIIKNNTYTTNENVELTNNHNMKHSGSQKEEHKQRE
jgi:hypothetical protein